MSEQYDAQLHSISQIAQHLSALSQDLEKTKQVLEQNKYLAATKTKKVSSTKKNSSINNVQDKHKDNEQTTPSNTESNNNFTSTLSDHKTKLKVIARISAQLHNDFQVSEHDLNELNNSFQINQSNDYDNEEEEAVVVEDDDD